MAQDGDANTGAEAGAVMGEVMGSRLGSGASSGERSGGFSNPSAERPSPVVSCEQAFTIMPLRYSAIVSADAAGLKKITPDFPADLALGQRLNEVAPLAAESAARYGIRALRAGHLYVFTKRIYVENDAGEGIEDAAGKWQLDYHLEVKEDEELLVKSAAQNYPRNLSGRTFIVNKPLDIIEMRLYFSPEPLTGHYVGLILEDAKATGGKAENTAKGRRLREAMQLVDIKAILEQREDSRGFKGQAPANVIPAMRIGEVLAEALAMPAAGEKRQVMRPEALFAAEAGIRILNDQLFRCKSRMVYHRAILNPWDNWFSGMAAGAGWHCGVGSVAVVLNDPIGITQELNNWRNDALETYYYTSFLNRQTEIDDKNGETKLVPNKRLVHALSTYENLAGNYGLLKVCGDVYGRWQSYNRKLQQGEDQLNKSRDYYQIAQMRLINLRRRHASDKELRDYEEQMRNQEMIKSKILAAIRSSLHEFRDQLKEAIKKRDTYQAYFNNELKPLVNIARADEAKAEYTQAWDEAVDVSIQRIPGHLAWLQSEALKTAFDYFDNRTEKVDDPENAGEQIDAPVKEAQGTAFTQHVGLAIVGMDGLTEAYKEVYNDWWEPLEGQDFDTENNLVMRAACFNNPGAFEAMKQLNTAIQKVEGELERLGINSDELTDAQKQSVGFAGVMKWTKKLAGYFKKILDMESPKNERLAGILSVTQQLQNRLLAYGGSTRLDYGVFVFFRNFTVAQVGDAIVANEVASHYSGLNGKSRPRRIISREIEHRWNKNYAAAGNVAKVRMASILLVVDVLNLAAVIFKGEAKREDLIKLFSAAFGTLGTAVSYYTTLLQGALGSYELPEVPPNHTKGLPPSKGNYQFFITRSRYFNFKMIGACLSAAAQTPLLLMEAYKSFHKGDNAWEHENWFIATGYGLQIAFSAVSLAKVLGDTTTAVSKALTALAQFESYNSTMATKLGIMRAATARAAGVAAARSTATRFALGASFGAGAARCANQLFGLNPVGITIFILTLVLPMVLDALDNVELEKWLTRFTLRNIGTSNGTSLYADLDDEIEYLQKALNNLNKGVPIDVFHQEYIVNEEAFLAALDKQFYDGLPGANPSAD